ncbi:hypothetical protein WA026_004900 [Henosepilachna vigintioctopunctata]|uniref:ZAD domain-containing protein n=1 Tax=Henosepilachna vigintioctopunctata TaxID=420089 RepID=A0AAW1US05_9CUCU
METEIPLGFNIGDKFKSWNEFHNKLLAACKDKYVQFYKRDSLTIQSALKKVKRYLKKDLEYYKVQYCCIYGGREFKSVGTGKRNKKTFRSGPLCPATLTIRVSSSGDEFELISLNMIHNHPTDAVAYENLPHQKKLSKIKEKPKCSKVVNCISDNQLNSSPVNTTEETHTISIDNVNQLCRLCISERNLSKSKNIFQTQIRFMVEYCSSVRVSENDGLPSRICLPCLESLTRFYSFKKKIERTDNMLRSLFQSIESKPNILNISVNEDGVLGDYCDNMNDVDHFKDSELLYDTVNNDLDCKFPLKDTSIETQGEIGNILTEGSDVVKNNSMSVAQSTLTDDNRLEENGSQESMLGIFTKNNDDKSSELLSAIQVEDQIFPKDINSLEVPPLVPLNQNKKPKIISSILPEMPPPLIPLKPNINEDIHSSTNTSSLQCRNCKQIFHTLSSLKKHRLECIPSNSLTCNICKKNSKRGRN